METEIIPKEAFKEWLVQIIVSIVYFININLSSNFMNENNYNKMWVKLRFNFLFNRR